MLWTLTLTLRLLWRLMELILEGASLYFRSAPAPNLPWLDAPTQLEQLQGQEGAVEFQRPCHHAEEWISSELTTHLDRSYQRLSVIIACIRQNGAELSKRAKEQQFVIILINNILVNDDNWDNSGPTYWITQYDDAYGVCHACNYSGEV